MSRLVAGVLYHNIWYTILLLWTSHILCLLNRVMHKRNHILVPEFVMNTMIYYTVLAVYLLLFLLVIFFFFFSDTHAEGVLGLLSRFVSQSLPNAGIYVLRSIAGEAISESVFEWIDYIANKRNPLCQFTYLVILNGAYLVWLTNGQPLLPVLFVPNYHIYVVFVGIMICHFTFYLACAKGPGQVTSENLESFLHNPYDGKHIPSYATNFLWFHRSSHRTATFPNTSLPFHAIWMLRYTLYRGQDM